MSFLLIKSIIVFTTFANKNETVFSFLLKKLHDLTWLTRTGSLFDWMNRQIVIVLYFIFERYVCLLFLLVRLK